MNFLRAGWMGFWRNESM